MMGLIRTSCFIALAFIILFAWESTSSDEKNHIEDLFLRELVDPSSGKIDNNLVEELQFNCNLDLIHLKHAFTKRHSSFPSKKSHVYPITRSLSRENILRTTSLESLLDCLQKRNLLLRVSGDESVTSHWYSKYLNLVFSRENVHRRYLQTLTEEPSPGPAIVSPSPSPAPVSAPVPSPSTAPSSTPAATSPRTPFFPPIAGDSESGSPPTQNASSGPGSGSNLEGEKKSSSHKRSVVIAVAVTASVTFAIVTILFLCCSDYCKNGGKLGRNDERPLLSLSMSDFSIGGASPKLYPFGNGNPNKDNDRIGHGQYSFRTSSTPYTTGSSLGGSFRSMFNSIHTSSHNAMASGPAATQKFKPFEMANIASGQANPSLKPPPGRAPITPTAMPPLRPPPGRADPLPPEPPSSFKPPSARPGPPLPPPPPVQSLKPAASAGPPPPPPPPRPSPPPPPMPPSSNTGPRPPPPPPPKGGAPPRPTPLPGSSKVAPRPPPPAPRHQANASSSSVGASSDEEGDAPKAKLKPFFWDKVMANPDHSMVWHQIKSGSFQFDENMIETLFGYGSSEISKSEPKKESPMQDPSPQFIQIIDSKKSQNLAILLRALNVTIEEVCDALREGNELPSEFVENLLKMAPTSDEELKLRLFSGDPSQLGTAERFLKALVDIPFAFKRLQALLFMTTLTEEVAMVKESLETLEVACKELRNSRLFLKLLEAVLKTGNRMNDGTFRGGAQAFKLDTLLKLADVRGTDGKTTLLHFVVQEIIRSEGIRAVRVARENRSLSSIKSDDLLEEAFNDAEEHYRSLGLQAVSNLGNELENVKKASVLDADGLTGTVAKLGQSLLRTRQFLNSEMKSMEEDSGFLKTLKNFVENTEVEILGLLEEEKRIMALVKSTGDYFHGNAGKDEGLRLFIIVRDFLIMVDKACKEVRDTSKKRTKAPKKDSSSSDLRELGAPTSSSDTRQSPFDLRNRLFPAIADRRVGDSSSDEED